MKKTTLYDTEPPAKTHDELVAEAIKFYTRLGSAVETEVRLDAPNGQFFFADLVVWQKNGRVAIVEAKSQREASRVGAAIRQFKTYVPFFPGAHGVLWIDNQLSDFEVTLLEHCGCRFDIVVNGGPDCRQFMGVEA